MGSKVVSGLMRSLQPTPEISEQSRPDSAFAHRVTELKNNPFSSKGKNKKDNCWICEGWQEVKFTIKPLV